MLIRTCASSAVFAVALVLLGSTTTTASAPPACNQATGDKLEKRLPIGPFDTRVGQTLCFDFTGDGVRDIVFTGWIYANAGPHYWAAFRARGDDWQRVTFRRDCCRPRRANKIRVYRFGAMVVVRQPIYRERDRGCCPTGGTRTGRWRWNGRTLRLLGTSEKPR